jgi:hypothetical protein
LGATEQTKKIELMENTYAAAMKRDGAWRIRGIEEIPGVIGGKGPGCMFVREGGNHDP